MGNNAVASTALLVVFILMMYFMMIRPQRKKEKEEREMRSRLTVGDEVITIGGVVGRIEKITEKTVVISTGGAAKNKIEFLKTAIGSVVKSDSSSDSKKDSKADAKEDEAAPSRDKKVTPKKLGKKSEDSKEA